MVKRGFIFCLTVLFCGLYAAPLWANISIFPYSVDFEANGRKRVQTVRVINISDKEQTYRVSFVNFNQGPQGQLTEVNTDSGPYARKYLVFSPRQFHLKPHEMQTINVARRGIADLADGEYVSHLKIQEVKLGEPDKGKAKDDNLVSLTLKPLFAVTIPVTIEKGNNLVSKTELVSARALNSRDLSVTLKRAGNISSRVNLVVVDPKGEEIGRLNSVKIYTTAETLSSKVSIKEGTSFHNAVLKIEDARTKEEILHQDIHM